MQERRVVLVLRSHIPDNNKAMSQSMVQKKKTKQNLSNHVMTSYINVNNCCDETKHWKQTKALYLRHIAKHSYVHNAHARVESK